MLLSFLFVCCFLLFGLYLRALLTPFAMAVVLGAAGGSFNAGGALCNNPQLTLSASTLVSGVSSVKKNKCVSQLRIPFNLVFQRLEVSQYV